MVETLQHLALGGGGFVGSLLLLVSARLALRAAARRGGLEAERNDAVRRASDLEGKLRLAELEVARLAAQLEGMREALRERAQGVKSPLLSAQFVPFPVSYPTSSIPPFSSQSNPGQIRIHHGHVMSCRTA